MKGKITKSDDNWVVKYEDILKLHPTTQHGMKELPLHPDDIKQIKRDVQMFDNIEARIAAYHDVEFDLCVIVQPDGKGKEYAKLLNN
jgi:hypothetical protein